MNGIEKITQRIAEDLQREIDAIEAQARAEAQAITQDYARQAVQMAEEMTHKGEVQARELEERLRGAAHMEDAKARLTVKQEMIDRAFALAMERLCALPKKERQAFLVKLTVQAARSGREQLFLSPRDRKEVGEAVVREANACLDQGKLTLAPESRPIQGGVILSDGAVEVNGSFESLLRQARTAMAGDVAKILFP